jgi:hypothetical protein
MCTQVSKEPRHFSNKDHNDTCIFTCSNSPSYQPHSLVCQAVGKLPMQVGVVKLLPESIQKR